MPMWQWRTASEGSQPRRCQLPRSRVLKVILPKGKPATPLAMWPTQWLQTLPVLFPGYAPPLNVLANRTAEDPGVDGYLSWFSDSPAALPRPFILYYVVL